MQVSGEWVSMEERGQLKEEVDKEWVSHQGKRLSLPWSQNDQHWHRVPREVVGAPCLETFKARLVIGCC